MSDNVTGKLLELFNRSMYFTSLEDFSYFLGLFGLLLAVIQFGLPYAQPFAVRLLPKDRRIKVSLMLNKILGFTALGSLIMFPFLMALFVARVVNSFALYIGFALWNSVWVMVGSSVIFLIVFTLVGRFWLKKYILSDIFELPQTDMQMLKNETANLSRDMKELTREMHEFTEELKRERNEHNKGRR